MFMQVRVVPAKYVMKCDDDTFVRIDSVLDQVKKVQSDRSVYVGSINYFHRPLRSGKWAVTYEVNCHFLIVEPEIIVFWSCSILHLCSLLLATKVHQLYISFVYFLLSDPHENM